MDDSDIELTEEDWEAAREAFRHNPALRQKAGTADPERKFAELHNRWGRSRFELLLGLRQPRKYSEHRDLAAVRGEITPIEALRKFIADVHRPVDKTMLETFLKEYEERLHRYACFLQAVDDLRATVQRNVPSRHEEAKVDQQASSLCEKSKLYKQEINNVRQFLQEARVTKRMWSVEMGGFTAPTACELIARITHYAQESWKEQSELALKRETRLEHGRVMLGIELFEMYSLPHLPNPSRLETLLLEEGALARICLREQLASRGGEAVDVACDRGLPEPAAASHLISVKSWSDLAIGIDEHGAFWAITPPPSPGQVFKKSQATKLSLPGNRWEVVLKAFAKATEDDQVRRDDLMREFGYLPPMASIERDSRAQPGAVESGQIDGLQIRQLAAVKRLTNAMSDLRRELRKLVDCPRSPPNCLRADGSVIRSEFVVQYLMRDESDRLIFGQPRP